MLKIGYHESTSNGFYEMGKEAILAGASTFAFFTRNPRGGQAKEIDVQDAQKLQVLLKENNFAKLVAHAPYTMNPCSADEGLRNFAREMMIDDLRRMNIVSGNYYNFHPGSHVKQGAEAGIDFTSTMLCDVIKAGYKEGTLPGTVILIETMSGKGSEIGRNFYEINEIIRRTEEKLGQKTDDVLGVCMDSCHVWDGGYDIVNDLDGVLTEFDKIVGLNRLKACHLNDSMNELDSHKDRHQKIGQGKIGFEALSKFARHPSLKDLPFILETPNDFEGYKKEIEMLKASFAE